MKITKRGYILVPKNIKEEVDHENDKTFFAYKKGCNLVYFPWFNLSNDCKLLKEYLANITKTSYEEISNLANEILYRQFYHGEDNIVDRTETQYVKVIGTKEILSKVNTMIQSKIVLWDEGEYGEFFKEICKILKINPSVVINDFLNKIKSDMELGGDVTSMLDSGSIFALAMGKTLLSFHERIHDELVFHLVQYNFEFKDWKDFQDKWKELSTRLSTEHSLLLNLEILSELGRITGCVIGEEIREERIKLLIDDVNNKTPKKKGTIKKKGALPGLPSLP